LRRCGERQERAIDPRHCDPMSAPGHFRTSRPCCGMSVLPPRADILNSTSDVGRMPEVLSRAFRQLTLRHRHRWTDRGPRRPCHARRRIRRASPRSAALWTVDRLQIRGELPGSARIAHVVLLQKQEERETEAASGKTTCAVMARRATICKQPRGRFALIEILSMRRSSDEHIYGAKDQQAAPQFWLQ
jgi:hypothetical protein